jgi:hypothetical protein
MDGLGLTRDREGHPIRGREERRYGGRPIIDVGLRGRVVALDRGCVRTLSVNRHGSLRREHSGEIPVANALSAAEDLGLSCSWADEIPRKVLIEFVAKVR